MESKPLNLKKCTDTISSTLMQWVKDGGHIPALRDWIEIHYAFDENQRAIIDVHYPTAAETFAGKIIYHPDNPISYIGGIVKMFDDDISYQVLMKYERLADNNIDASLLQECEIAIYFNSDLIPFDVSFLPI